jgi:hypothetical protein
MELRRIIALVSERQEGTGGRRILRNEEINQIWLW